MRRLHGKMGPRLTGLPYQADRATSLGGLPHLSCKHDQIKIRDYMERRVTPPRRATSPTWGPPPPCKQALKLQNKAKGYNSHFYWIGLPHPQSALYFSWLNRAQHNRSRKQGFVMGSPILGDPGAISGGESGLRQFSLPSFPLPSPPLTAPGSPRMRFFRHS